MNHNTPKRQGPFYTRPFSIVDFVLIAACLLSALTFVGGLINEYQHSCNSVIDAGQHNQPVQGSGNKVSRRISV